MDTFCSISVVSQTAEKADEAIEAGFTEIRKLESLLNYFTDDSEVTAINKSAGIRPVKVNPETLDIIQKTLKISRKTGGAFDPTIAPVIRQWPFSSQSAGSGVPSRADISRILKLVDYREVKVREEEVTVYLEERGMEIDLGGIAKGYAADRAVETIKATGIKAALVAVAGDIRGYGTRPSGDNWNIGIQNPRPSPGDEKPWEDIFARLELKDSAISTSGDYQRFVIKKGKRYHHILNPETGYPAESGLMSVSVIAPEGYLSDSLSTAVFVLGAERGMRLIESMNMDAVIVDKGNNVQVTSGMTDKLDILHQEYRISD